MTGTPGARERSLGMRQLEAFREVVRLGSFSAGAQRLALSQPTVSAHVAELERLFGARLVDRVGRRARPTHSGRVLFDYATRILDLRARAVQAMGEIGGTMRGTLRIGASTVPALYLLPARIRLFRDRNPEAKVEVVTSDSEEILGRVAAGDLELGYVGSAPRLPDLAHRRFAEDHLVLVVPPRHRWARRRAPVEVADLAAETFVAREEGSGTRRAFDRAFAAAAGGEPPTLREAVRVGSTEAVREAVRQGIGVAFLSDLAVDRTVRAVAVRGLSIRREFHEVWNRRTTLSPLALAFQRLGAREEGTDQGAGR